MGDTLEDTECPCRFTATQICECAARRPADRCVCKGCTRIRIAALELALSLVVRDQHRFGKL